MIYQINGDQPFQVLSTNFSVSPSESGYNLQISANGIDYTDFATVGAGVTRQFTGMANGNFYRLSGNTGTVEVNWMRECSPAGGGGAAGVSSLDGQTGALTTKTIGGQSILGTGDIPVGGGGDYVVVEDLSAITNPTEGMVAFVPEHTVSETLEFVKAYFVGVENPEDYLGRFRRTSDSGETRSVYQSGSRFFWDPWMQFNGQYSFHTVTIEDGYDAIFRPYNDSENPGNSWIEFTIPDGMFFEVQNGGADGATTAVTSETITTLIPNTFYQYNGSSWDKLDVKKKYFLNTMTDAERLALWSDINALIASGVSVNEVYSFYGDFYSQHSYNQVPHQLEYLRDTGNQKWFVGFVTHTDNPSEIWILQYKINSDGSGELGMSVNYSYEAKNAKILGNGDQLKYSVTNGSIKINDTDIANYTGTTCSGNLSEVNFGTFRTYLDGGWGPQMFYNILEIYSGDTKIGIANNPTVSYTQFSPAVTCTDPESNQVDFDTEVRYDYGKYLFTCWLSSTNNQRIANVSITTN